MSKKNNEKKRRLKFEFILRQLNNNDESLEECCLSWFELNDNDVIELAYALCNHESVHTLDLSSNYIKDQGMMALAGALIHHPSISTLKLYNNSISDDGIEALAQALQTNTVLTILDLQQNEITSRGATLLAQALQPPPEHEEFDEENKIGDDDRGKYNTTLGYLDLAHNIMIGKQGGRALYEMMARNASIAYLNLDGTEISPVLHSYIEECVERNLQWYQQQQEQQQLHQYQHHGQENIPTSSNNNRQYLPPQLCETNHRQESKTWNDAPQPTLPKRQLPRQGSFGMDPLHRPEPKMLSTLYFVMSFAAQQKNDLQNASDSFSVVSGVSSASSSLVVQPRPSPPTAMILQRHIKQQNELFFFLEQDQQWHDFYLSVQQEQNGATYGPQIDAWITARKTSTLKHAVMTRTTLLTFGQVKEKYPEFDDFCPVALSSTLLFQPFHNQKLNDFYYHMTVKLQGMMEVCQILHNTEAMSYHFKQNSTKSALQRHLDSGGAPSLLEESTRFAFRQHGIFAPIDAMGFVLEILSHYRTLPEKISILDTIHSFLQVCTINNDSGSYTYPKSSSSSKKITSGDEDTEERWRRLRRRRRYGKGKKKHQLNEDGLAQLVEHVARMTTASSNVTRVLTGSKSDERHEHQRALLLQRLGMDPDQLTPIMEEGCRFADRALKCISDPKSNGHVRQVLNMIQEQRKQEQEETEERQRRLEKRRLSVNKRAGSLDPSTGTAKPASFSGTRSASIGPSTPRPLKRRNTCTIPICSKERIRDALVADLLNIEMDDVNLLKESVSLGKKSHAKAVEGEKVKDRPSRRGSWFAKGRRPSRGDNGPAPMKTNSNTMNAVSTPNISQVKRKSSKAPKKEKDKEITIHREVVFQPRPSDFASPELTNEVYISAMEKFENEMAKKEKRRFSFVRNEESISPPKADEDEEIDPGEMVQHRGPKGFIAWILCCACCARS